MPTRQRVVMTVSVPPETAKEYKKLAEAKGETISQLFRDMYAFYKREKLKEEFYKLQGYGATKAKELKITEKDIEKLVFEGR
ncbi:MAG: CopG family transcriptional regulator [Nitrospiraceae bacterium]|nr:MAG: CopG family transcriptional regulator [Nitrospiraceae bacterium]